MMKHVLAPVVGFGLCVCAGCVNTSDVIAPLEDRNKAFFVCENLQPYMYYSLNFEGHKSGEAHRFKGTITFYDADGKMLRRKKINQRHLSPTVDWIRIKTDESELTGEPILVCMEGDLARFVTEANKPVFESKIAIGPRKNQ